jgi:hypothetical protein
MSTMTETVRQVILSDPKTLLETGTSIADR